jgi:tryptophan synthase beta chain
MQSAENEPVNKSLPDERGHFGVYGGRFVPETLMRPLDELNQAYEKYLKDPEFLAELDADLAHYVGRPSPLYFAERLSRETGGADRCRSTRGCSGDRGGPHGYALRRLYGRRRYQAPGD